MSFNFNVKKRKLHMPKSPNYTGEQVTEMLAAYAEKGNAVIPELAEKFSKSTRSIISKLVREQVYVAPDKPEPAPKVEGPTKAELLASMKSANFDPDGLENATRSGLVKVLDLIENPATVQPQG